MTKLLILLTVGTVVSGHPVYAQRIGDTPMPGPVYMSPAPSVQIPTIPTLPSTAHPEHVTCPSGDYTLGCTTYCPAHPNGVAVPTVSGLSGPLRQPRSAPPLRKVRREVKDGSRYSQHQNARRLCTWHHVSKQIHRLYAMSCEAGDRMGMLSAGVSLTAIPSCIAAFSRAKLE
jgi:hypothetical protein